MAVLPITVETTEDTTYTGWDYRKTGTKTVTRKGFVRVWQLASSLEDVVETLAAHGVTPPTQKHPAAAPYTLQGVRAKAAMMRDSDRIPLKQLQSVTRAARAAEKALQEKLARECELQELRALAKSLAA